MSGAPVPIGLRSLAVRAVCDIYVRDALSNYVPAPLVSRGGVVGRISSTYRLSFAAGRTASDVSTGPRLRHASEQ